MAGTPFPVDPEDPLAPARVAFANGLAISRLKLGMQKAVIEVDGRISPALDLHAAAHQIDAALINTFVPGVLAQGTFDADAKLTGSPSANFRSASGCGWN